MGWRRRSADDFSEEIRAHIAHETDRLVAEGHEPGRGGPHRPPPVRQRDRCDRALLRIAPSSVARRAAPGLPRCAPQSRPLPRRRRRRRALARRRHWRHGRITDDPRRHFSEPAAALRPAAAAVEDPGQSAGPADPANRQLRASRSFHEVAAGDGAHRCGRRRPRRRQRCANQRAQRARARPRRDRRSLLSARRRSRRSAECLPRAATRREPEAVLSYRLWQEWFGGRQDALGATIWIDKQPHTVIGVMPRRFWFSEMTDPVWTRLEPDRLTAETALQVIVRRPTGTSHDALAASLQGSLDAYSRQLPASRGPLKMRVSEIKGTPMANEMALIISLHPRHRGPADAAHRLRQRRDPDDCAVDET